MKNVINYIAQGLFVAIIVSVIALLVGIIANQVIVSSNDTVQITARVISAVIFIGGIIVVNIIEAKRGSVN